VIINPTLQSQILGHPAISNIQSHLKGWEIEFQITIHQQYLREREI
jgi:hypothetical protein